uniref:Photosystem II protein N n=1 Tax=Dioscorea zingiberensis TaxID=325984 RepID=A0A0F6SUJ8_9LILI|nr:photosystem II protein N [Dioscorea zingiberensis]AKF33674.1 photosystem II protein N [Dioscorea zingiberensis]
MKNGNSNPNRHLHIWFTCKLYWVRFIYRFGQPSQQLRDPFEEHGD